MRQQVLFLGALLFFFLGHGQTITVNCGADPLIVDYCYGNDNTDGFTYVSSDGSPLTLSIISGQVEEGNDSLVIYDTDGSTILNNYYGNNGDISGTTIQSTGDSISFLIDSNSTVSCDSGSAGLTDGISYMVFCGSCNINIELGPDQNSICEEDAPFILNAEDSNVEYYEWYKDGFVINGATDSTLEVTESGNYSVTGFNGICVDYDEININFLNCATTGIIEVNAFIDANGNSIFDITEDNFLNGYITYELNDDGVMNTLYTSTGQFYLYVEDELDSYDITYNFYDETQSCYTATIASVENITAGIGDVVMVEFPLVPLDSCEDLGVFLYNTNVPPRPGFNYQTRITLQNFGNEEISSGTVEFLHDALLEFDDVMNINPNYTVTPIAGGLSIDFVDLLPNDIEDIYLQLYCPITVSLGTMVTNTLSYITSESDTDASNNSSVLSQVVVGSYDPNDIMESHGPQIVYDDFIASDEYLYYTIRFQNVGTAEAINVRIEDVLDAQLDKNSFKMLSSSHDYVVTRTEDQLTWQFNDIDLPSESTDAEGSNGFVYFKIKPLAGYVIGDIIPNVADIFFDFNSPITTNVFNTEFVETLSVPNYEVTNFLMYPSPATGSVTLNFGALTDGSINIFDIQGKSILSMTVMNKNSIELDIEAFESGLYFLKFSNGSIEVIKKLIVE